MADEADHAFALEQQSLNAALSAQKAKSENLKATGHCHYCYESLNSKGNYFCDIDCAKDWEGEQEVLRRQGRLKGLFSKHLEPAMA